MISPAAGLPAPPALSAVAGWSRPDGRDGQPRHVAAGAAIYAEGDDAGSYFRLAEGVARTCRYLADGRRQIDAFYARGEVFGLETGATRRLTAEAVSDCTVICYRRGARMPDSVLLDSVLLDPVLLDHVLHGIEQAREHACLLAHRGAGEKLAAFLLGLAKDSRPDAVKPGAVKPGAVIELPMGRRDIADYLGLTIETVSRTFSQFERDRAIRMPGLRQVVLTRPEMLEELAA